MSRQEMDRSDESTFGAAGESVGLPVSRIASSFAGMGRSPRAVYRRVDHGEPITPPAPPS